MPRNERGSMSDVSNVKGIGPKALSLLNKIGISTIDDLVTHYPFRYDILKQSDLSKVTPDDKVIIDGKVESIPILLRFKAGLNKLNFRLVTTTGIVGVSIFNRAFMKSNLTIGTNVIVIGKYDSKKNIITASDIKFGLLNNQAKIEPVYHCTSGLTNKNMSTYINTALLMNGKDITDYIPTDYQNKYHFSNKKTALNIAHNPPTLEKLKEAQIRLKYEELFSFMFKINYLKEQHKEERTGIKRDIPKNSVLELFEKLPFELTTDQKNAVWEIYEDMNK